MLFVEGLSRLLPDHLTADLRAWVDDFAVRQGIPRYQISRLRISSPPPMTAPTTSYVMTELRPYGADEQRYLSRISLRHHGPVDQVLHGQVLHDDGVPLTLTEIPSLFDLVLSGVWDATTVEINELVIEFLLPFELLGHAVDQWQVQTDRVPHPVGAEHLVVVRSSDREKRSHVQWRRKTSHLRNGQAAVRWMDPFEDDVTQLYFDLLDERVPCLALTRPPRLAREMGSDAISAGISAGVPVIVWCRADAHAALFTARLRADLDQRGGADLPVLVHRLRRDCVRFGDPTGAHITLIWDPADQPTGLVVRHQAPTQ